MSEENKHITGFRPDGHLDENSLAACSDWLNGDLEELDEHLQSHLSKCEYCKQAVLDISEISKEEDRSDEPLKSARQMFEETCAARHSPSIKSGSGNQFWRVAAVILVLATVTAIALLIRPDRGPSLVNNVETDDSAEINQKEQLQDSARPFSDSTSPGESGKPVGIESVQGDLYAENYTPNPGFEALIGAQFRTGADLGITNPGNDTVMLQNEYIVFTGFNSKHEVLEIQILNNRAEMIKAFAQIDRINLKVKMDVDPGLYYWKLLGEDELHQVGKIRIEEGD